MDDTLERLFKASLAKCKCLENQGNKELLYCEIGHLYTLAVKMKKNNIEPSESDHLYFHYFMMIKKNLEKELNNG